MILNRDHKNQTALDTPVPTSTKILVLVVYYQIAQENSLNG
ncbi:MAG: hypothetical protein H6Q73_1927 [Firmicutes bacterium]|nr:hypothetical protein [Bacillota bacterium]